MRRFALILFGLMILTQFSTHAGEAWSKRVGELVQPAASVGLPPNPPATFPEPKRLLDPPSPLPKFQEEPPRPPLLPAKIFLPTAPAEPMPPLVSYLGSPAAPQEIVMPTTPLIVLPIVDVTQPPPLPILATPTSDRAPLSDATLDASIAAALAQAIPSRVEQVPFTAINLPEPFELQQMIRLPNPPAELTQPMPVPVRIFTITLPIIELKK
jgi:hypothetical protein